MKNNPVILALIILIPLLTSCGGRDKGHIDSGSPIEIRHAVNLSMEDLGEGSTLVTIRNPWDTTKTLARYVLVERGRKTTSRLPEGTTAITVPLERAVVYSGVHVSLIDEMGSAESVKGICDAEYMTDPAVRKGIEAGKIADCGQSMSPNMERIVSLRPQAILLSPYEKSDEAARFARTGINVIEMADYMEATPLGRAEWMRFYGRLFGKGEKADSMFLKTERQYEAQRAKAASAASRPSVMFDRIYSGVWDVPTSGSVTGHLIEDAGGINPFAGYRQGGSAHLSPEEVLIKAGNADIWLIRHLEPELSLEAIGKDNEIYKRFKPFRTGAVYGVNTLTSTYFEDGAFHPQKILEEMVKILHPELSAADSPLRYYKRI